MHGTHWYTLLIFVGCVVEGGAGSGPTMGGAIDPDAGVYGNEASFIHARPTAVTIESCEDALCPVPAAAYLADESGAPQLFVALGLNSAMATTCSEPSMRSSRWEHHPSLASRGGK